MPSCCFVPGCNSGYKSCKEKVILFKAPKENLLREKWNRAIPRDDRVLKETDFICEKHFCADDIKRFWKSGSGELVVEVPYKHPKLTNDAIPRLFPNCPSYLSKPKKKRKSPKKREIAVKVPKICCIENSKSNEESGASIEEPEPIIEESTVDTINVTQNDLFENLIKGTSKVEIPAGWMMQYAPKFQNYLSYIETYYKRQRDGALISHIRRNVVIRKVDDRLEVRMYVYGKEGKMDGVNSTLGNDNPEGQLSDIFHRFSTVQLCSGANVKKEERDLHSDIEEDSAGFWRHSDCNVASGCKQCKNCSKLRKILSQRKYRRRKAQMENKAKLTKKRSNIKTQCHTTNLKILRMQLRATYAKYYRAQKRVKNLLSQLKKMHQKMDEISMQSVTDKLKEMHPNIPKPQLTVIEEILNAAKRKSSKGNRFTDDWMLLCMLMHIRSPGLYNMMRNNQILPLPSPRTIRNYLALVNTKCGFDPEFLKLFKKFMSEKSPLQRDGLILIDEIATREAVKVNTCNLTYKGLVDMGEDGKKAETLDEKANHGLVVMYQPLAGNYSQPIAVFASRGTVTSKELAKIVLKSICLLEECGARIHGVVSDGAQTNKGMWGELGCSGHLDKTCNYFPHPTVEGRKVFLFSDTPHIIKCIRNRLFNKETLRMRPHSNWIRWQHLKILHDIDKNLGGYLRVCPKLTDAHFTLTSSTKMRVALATQMFSKSVADGLKFHQNRNVKGLRDCQETIDFCLRINNMFDALNRKNPREGVTSTGSDFEELKSDLEWLDNWERQYKAEKIPENDFLTRETAQSLRMTLHSTMDLIVYLETNFQFKYVLTGKINQDPLERFFGIIRQACGANDHPDAPTFLQLYKLMSVYSVIKPPKRGNCTVDDTGRPKLLITMADLKDLVSGPTSAAKVEELKNKINVILEDDDWDIQDILQINEEHSYNKASVVECVIYYVTGWKEIMCRCFAG